MMAKKIRFPLEMENGVKVRDLRELRENFSLARVLIYFSNGKLITWLRDRYVDDIADEVEKLNIEDIDLPKKISELFDVSYDEKLGMDLEKAKERNHKLEILKKYTTEQCFLDEIDNVAFTQDDLYDLLDEGKNTIYLCGEEFFIPLAKKDMSYIGINKPVVIIDSKTEVDWKEKNITLKNVLYDEEYQKIIDNTTKTYENYKKSYLNFMLSPSDKKLAEKSYNNIKDEILSLNFDIDKDIYKIKNLLKDAGLIGMASSYIDNL